MGCHALLQGILPTQGWNPGLLHYRQILYHLRFMRELGPREEITDLSSSLSLVSFYIEKINKQTDTEKSPQCLPGISETLKILSSFPPSLTQSLIKHLRQEEGVK